MILNNNFKDLKSFKLKKKIRNMVEDFSLIQSY